MTAITEHIPLNDKTFLRTGGRARYYCAVESVEDIVGCTEYSHKHNVPIFVLGYGSNSVMNDNGYMGLVVDCRRRFNCFRFEQELLIAQSGSSLMNIVCEAVGRGLSGVEALGGIPGSIGGAVVMNAGAHGSEIGACVESVTCVDRHNGLMKTVPGSELQFSYRSSIIHQKPLIIVEVRLKLTPGNISSIKQTYTDLLNQRAAKQPLNKPSCGSVFKNPAHGSAGALIEQCGCKGMQIGGMMVSVKHANFIVNNGTGTSTHYHQLVFKVQKTVLEKTGILLEPEVEFVGDF